MTTDRGSGRQSGIFWFQDLQVLLLGVASGLLGIPKQARAGEGRGRGRGGEEGREGGAGKEGREGGGEGTK